VVRESRDAKAAADGSIWYPTLNLRWRNIREVVLVRGDPPSTTLRPVLEQLWRRPDTFEERWRQVEYVEAD
jgi:hypothetical protein